MLNWEELKIKVICSKLRVRLRFYGFLSFFGTFGHKVAQTWFVLHENWHTIIFGIYYCVEMVKIQNHSHIVEIPCYIAILQVFKLLWHFRA